MAKKYNICLDVGGTKVLGVVFNEKDEIIHRVKKKTKSMGSDANNIEKLIINIVKELIDGAGIKKSEINAIAAGAPAIVDEAAGIVLDAPNLPWKNYDLKTPIEKEFGVPFYVANDVNAGVLGEFVYGAAKGHNYVVGLFPGTGMGGGMVLDGKLYTGYGYKGAEVGHMIVQPDGPLCPCGQRGCLEAFSSKKGMSAYIEEQTARGRESYLSDKIVNGVFKSSHLKKALDKKDPVAMEAVDRACHYMAIATGSLINIFSPEIVVYGGGVMEACGDIFLEKIVEEVGRYCRLNIIPTVKFVKAGLGDYSNVYGSLAMIKGY